MSDATGWVRLLPGEDDRIREGHLWIYRNEIAETGGGFSDGDLVWAEDSNRAKLGLGYINRKSLISVRLLARGAGAVFDEAAFAERLRRALAKREHLGECLKVDAVRLINAEADFLPGLVVDRYGDVVVAQLQTLFWEKWKDRIVGELEGALKPRAIVLRNDSLSREAEGLERYTEIARGSLEGEVVIREGEIRGGAGGDAKGGVEIEVDVIKGHKTGFYIDQRENRKMALPHVKNKRVLDCCCYTGAWSLMSAAAGAEHVLGLDYSAAAIGLARKNADRNDLTDRTEFRKADAFDELQVLASNREKFGVILLDPPSLARSRKGRHGAERGYLHLHRLAMGLLSPGGILVTCSCSHHVSSEKLREILSMAAGQVRKQVTVLGIGGQPEDHPSLLGVPETDYLKCFMLRVE
jgi:23S rRNA (cytosine1962-C5)-methyltransferase